ncbi:MAG TPA: calcium-binding protein [Stellaceae bacterium]
MTNYVVNSAMQTTADNTPVFNLKAFDQLFLSRNGLLSATGINSAAIAGAPAALYLDGEVFASNGNPLNLSSSSVFIDVGPTGTIEAFLTAVFIDGGNSEITNHGMIYGNLGIVTTHGGNTVLNFGQINSIGNDAVLLAGASGENSNYFENHGTVSGSLAYQGGDVSDQVVNLGTMSGGVVLGGGRDSFDGRNGMLVRGGVSGGDGDDILSGGQGDDSFSGDAGNDQLFGYGGNDFLFGGDGNDTIDGGDGDDIISGGNGADTLTGGPGADSFDGGAGIDTVSYAAAGRGVTADFASPSRNAGDAAGDTYTGVENLTGSRFNDDLAGDGNGNRIDGGAGADRMSGGAGNDNYTVDNTGDVIVELAGQGTDTVLSGVSYVLSANLENLTLTGRGNVNGTGNTQANTILGNPGNNVLDGRAGADLMKGGAGNDIYVVDNPGDVVTELAGQGSDTVRSGVSYVLPTNVETLALTGSGNSNAIGNPAANSLFGNSGNNVLDGRAGNDMLTGGAGGDVFVFDTALSAAGNLDTVLDFSPKDDSFRLSRSVFAAAGKPGPLAPAAFFAGIGAHDADDRIVYNAGAHRLLYDKDGTGPAAAVPFAVLNGSPALTSADFFIVA